MAVEVAYRRTAAVRATPTTVHESPHMNRVWIVLLGAAVLLGALAAGALSPLLA